MKIFPKKIPTFQIFQQALSPTISTLSGLDIDNQQNIQRAHLLVTVSNVSGILPEMVPLTPHTYTPASSMSTLISLRLPPTIFECGSGFLSVNKPISLTCTTKNRFLLPFTPHSMRLCKHIYLYSYIKNLKNNENVQFFCDIFNDVTIIITQLHYCQH